MLDQVSKPGLLLPNCVTLIKSLYCLSLISSWQNRSFFVCSIQPVQPCTAALPFFSLESPPVFHVTAAILEWALRFTNWVYAWKGASWLSAVRRCWVAKGMPNSGRRAVDHGEGGGPCPCVFLLGLSASLTAWLGSPGGQPDFPESRPQGTDSRAETCPMPVGVAAPLRRGVC